MGKIINGPVTYFKKWSLTNMFSYKPYFFTRRVNELLQRPLPNSGLSNMCTNLIEKIGVLEKQVLEQLKTLEAEKEAKKLKIESEKSLLSFSFEIVLVLYCRLASFELFIARAAETRQK